MYKFVFSLSVHMSAFYNMRDCAHVCIFLFQINIVIFINVIRILVQKLKSSTIAGNNDTGHFMWVTARRHDHNIYPSFTLMHHWLWGKGREVAGAELNHWITNKSTREW